MFLDIINFSVVLVIGSLGAFLVVAGNLLNIILLCEVVWICLYFYFVSVGSDSDALLIFIWGLFFLCLATGESVIGLSLLLFKFAIEGSIRKFYGSGGEGNLGKKYSKFWNSKN